MTAERRFASLIDVRRPRPPKRVSGLDVTPVEDGFLIYQASRDRVHHLNHTALLVLELCDGKSSAESIAEALTQAYGWRGDVLGSVRDVLERARAEGLTE